MSKLISKEDSHQSNKVVPNNLVIITSDIKLLYKSIEVLSNNGFTDNSDILQLDNGDYSVVMKMK